jgi:hypothetical protein
VGSNTGISCIVAGQKDLSDNTKSSGTDEIWLWKWFDNQERYTIEQFGIGVVGIGALFFAYAQATFAFLKILIALVGLGGSLTLVMHMYGSRMTRNAILEKLRLSNLTYKDREEVIKSRDQKTNWFYYPPGWMMIYYMVLVSFAWVALVGYRLSVILQPTLSDNVRIDVLALASFVSFFFVSFMAVQQKKKIGIEK